MTGWNKNREGPWVPKEIHDATMEKIAILEKMLLELQEHGRVVEVKMLQDEADTMPYSRDPVECLNMAAAMLHGALFYLYFLDDETIAKNYPVNAPPPPAEEEAGQDDEGKSE